MGDRPQDVVVSKRCLYCGADKPLASFARSPQNAHGVDSRCRDCRRLLSRRRRRLERSQRVPDVSGLSDGPALSTAVLGALRTHYDGRPVRLLSDLRLSLLDSDPVTRVNAGLTMLALREIGLAIERIPSESIEAILDSLPDAEWQRLAERQAKRRAPPV